MMYNIQFPVCLLEAEKNLSVNQSPCRIILYFKHLPNLLVTSSTCNLTAMSGNNLSLCSLCKEFNLVETNSFLFTAHFHQTIYYLMKVCNYCNSAHTKQWAEKSGPSKILKLASQTEHSAGCRQKSERGERTDNPQHPSDCWRERPLYYSKKPAVLSRAGFYLKTVSPGNIMSCLEEMSVKSPREERLCFL